MAEQNRPNTPLGQEYLQPYRELIRDIQEEHPGFFQSLLEAQEAQRRENEVRTTAIIPPRMRSWPRNYAPDLIW